ncbi:MAG: 8-oxoguanine DNA glycosylase [Clostridiaceae bacterium]|jgi:N-glycosylase/DNA lyase|nr:8-oxoguanine DNA glycosylase [Clostridiaceae bacterium]
MEWYFYKNRVILRDVESFDLEQTFECGQCFRWRRLESGNWLGIVRGLVVEAEKKGDDIIFHNMSPTDFTEVWHDYFDLGRDYGTLQRKLAENDPIMEKAIEFAPGLRLLRQDFYETLISFIVSQNNNIPRIRRIIECLAENYGKPVEYKGQILYSFPESNVLSVLSEKSFECIRAGYRAKYIIRASQQALELDISALEGMDSAGVRQELLRFYGVGGKVADCIGLFSGLMPDAFPVDRWVRRVMTTLYPGSGTSNEEIAAFARREFGELAGIAQQYLFYYARENRIGMDGQEDQ